MLHSNFTAVKLVQGIAIVEARVLRVEAEVLKLSGEQGGRLLYFGDLGLGVGHGEPEDSSHEHRLNMIIIENILVLEPPQLCCAAS